MIVYGKPRTWSSEIGTQSYYHPEFDIPNNRAIDFELSYPAAYAAGREAISILVREVGGWANSDAANNPPCRIETIDTNYPDL